MKLFKKIIDKNTFYKESESLSELANFYQIDKGTKNTEDLPWINEYPNNPCFHYTKTYEKYLDSYKLDNVSLLEIGVCDKRFPYGSIKMWMGHFKNVDFYGMDNFWGHDLESKLKDIDYLNSNGINFIYADQSSFQDWDELNKLCASKFNFIIEDGSHWPNHMMISLWKSIGLIKSGGYYFMEDIQNPLKSRGWYKYDNALIGQELLETFCTKELKSSFLNDKQNKDIQDNFELVDLVLDPNKINYLAVFKKK